MGSLFISLTNSPSPPPSPGPLPPPLYIHGTWPTPGSRASQPERTTWRSALGDGQAELDDRRPEDRASGNLGDQGRTLLEPPLPHLARAPTRRRCGAGAAGNGPTPTDGSPGRPWWRWRRGCRVEQNSRTSEPNEASFRSTSMAAASPLSVSLLLIVLLLPASEAIYCDEDDCYDLLGYRPFHPPFHLSSCFLGSSAPLTDSLRAAGSSRTRTRRRSGRPIINSPSNSESSFLSCLASMLIQSDAPTVC
jgi:hypothetical protein